LPLAEDPKPKTHLEDILEGSSLPEALLQHLCPLVRNGSN
jgi:hypothetical protein